MTLADPAERLAAEFPADGARQTLARIDKARRRGKAARVAVIEVDAAGVVHVDVRFTVESGQREGVGK